MSIEQLQRAIREMRERYPQVTLQAFQASEDSVTFTLESHNPRGEPFHRHYEVDSMIDERHGVEFIRRSFSSMAGEVQKDIYA